ncbi:MAG: ATP-binding protein [Planctomycetes bacterium]|nr:ATP-binding protein [Planctomycetota bacterium]
MVIRSFWLKKIQDEWVKRSVVWLSGVRRTGKTFLVKSLPDIKYFDCELPRTRQLLSDPEAFLKDLGAGTVALDEIHRLENPSEFLKIAADHFPKTKIIATGSSTLGASARFKDTLTGRKAELWLTPIISEDLKSFGNTDLHHRFLSGGLPPFFMSENLPEKDYQEWMDSYWAKDIQELFHLERRYSFQKFVELLMLQSGGIFEATRFSKPCEVSRATISNYLNVLELTFVVNVIRPYSSRRSTEIISAPKVYGFDTGFICFYRGWNQLRQTDFGILWEHFVLNELNAKMQSRKILYWRDKRGHEVDFVIVRRGLPPCAIECKWSCKEFEPNNLIAFRHHYNKGANYVVSHDVDTGFTRRYNGITVNFVNLSLLADQLM